MAEICRSLDGLPLAVELAAARARALSVSEIAARLRDRFDLLVGRDPTAPERHHTLRAAVDWSYAALSEPERELFCRLAVFTGTFGIEAAECVCAAPAGMRSDVLDSLFSLADKSLVVSDASATERRYRLLETLRQYGAEKLRECGEEKRVRDCHLAWCVSLIETADIEMRGPDVRRWLATVDEEYDNVQGALGWADRGQWHELGLRLSSAMRRYWEMRNRVSDARAWFDRLLATDASVDPLIRARALAEASALAFCQDDSDEAEGSARESLALATAVGSDQEIARAWIALGAAASRRDELVAATGYYRQGLDAASRAADRFALAQALVNLGHVALLEGDVAGARHLLEQSLAIRRELGNPAYIGRSLSFIGMAAHREGRLEEAQALLDEAVALLRVIGDDRGLLQALFRAVDLHEARGDLDRVGVLSLEAAATDARIGSLRDFGGWLLRVADATLRAGDEHMGGYLLGAARRLLATRRHTRERDLGRLSHF